MVLVSVFFCFEQRQFDLHSFLWYDSMFFPFDMIVIVVITQYIIYYIQNLYIYTHIVRRWIVFFTFFTFFIAWLCPSASLSTGFCSNYPFLLSSWLISFSLFFLHISLLLLNSPPTQTNTPSHTHIHLYTHTPAHTHIQLDPRLPPFISPCYSSLA